MTEPQSQRLPAIIIINFGLERMPQHKREKKCNHEFDDTQHWYIMPKKLHKETRTSLFSVFVSVFIDKHREIITTRTPALH